MSDTTGTDFWRRAGNPPRSSIAGIGTEVEKQTLGNQEEDHWLGMGVFDLRS